MTNPVQNSTINVNTDSKVYSLPANDVEQKKSIKTDSSEKERHIQEATHQNEHNQLKETPVSKDTLSAAVEKLNDYVAKNKRNIHFSIDEDTSRTVVKLIDGEDNVLRQIPSEEVLHLIKSLEQNKGLILEDYA